MSVETTKLLIGGGVIFWRLASRFDHNLLQNNLAALGMEKFAPGTRTDESALREALKDVTKDIDDKMVRPLKDVKKDGFVVIKEEVGEHDNTYASLFTARVDEFRTIHTSTTDLAINAELGIAFQKHSGLVTSLSVATALVKILEHYGATSLRDGGGFYWLHEDRIDEWREVAKAVEAAADTSGEKDAKDKVECAIYLIRTQIDDLSARALTDAIVAEVKKHADEIVADAARPGLRQKTYHARQREAQALHDRIKYFENLLGDALPKLHECANIAENEVVNSALQAIPDFLTALGDINCEPVEV